MIADNLGWDYIQKLKANGAMMGQGSGQVVDDTASGDLKATLGVDYIVTDKMEKGASMGFFFPKEMLVIPSPVAIIKGTPNQARRRSSSISCSPRKGRRSSPQSGTLPVRSDVPAPKKFGLPSADEAVKRAMKLDYAKTMHDKEAIIKKFESHHARAQVNMAERAVARR